MDRRSSKTHLFISLTTLAVLAIFSISNPFQRPDQPYQKYTPPEWYKVIWDLTWSRCTTKFRAVPSYSYFSIKWYLVDAPHFNEYGTGDSVSAIIGLSHYNKIYIAKPYVNDIGLLAHEMLHAQGLHVYRYQQHPPIFKECSECIESVIANIVYGKPVRCFGNLDTLTTSP